MSINFDEAISLVDVSLARIPNTTTFSHEGGTITLPGEDLIVNTDTNELIAKVSKEYNLVEHKELINRIHPFIEENFQNYTIDVAINPNKSHMQWTYTLNSGDMSREIAVGDFVNARLRIGNSLNKSSSASIQLDMLRLACTNGMVSPCGTYSINMKHMSKLSTKFFSSAVVKFTSFFSEAVNTVSLWGNQACSKSRAINICSFFPVKLASMAINQIESDDDSMNSGFKGTRGSLYNLLTKISTHNWVPKKNTTASLQRIKIGKEISRIVSNNHYFEMDETDLYNTAKKHQDQVLLMRKSSVERYASEFDISLEE